MDPAIDPGYDPNFMGTLLGLVTYLLGAGVVASLGFWIMRRQSRHAELQPERSSTLVELSVFEALKKGDYGFDSHPKVQDSYRRPFRYPYGVEEVALNLAAARIAWAVGELRDLFPDSEAGVFAVSVRRSEHLGTVHVLELTLGVGGMKREIECMYDRSGYLNASCSVKLPTRPERATLLLTGATLDQLPKKLALAFVEGSEERILGLIFGDDKEEKAKFDSYWSEFMEYSGWEDGEQL